MQVMLVVEVDPDQPNLPDAAIAFADEANREGFLGSMTKTIKIKHIRLVMGNP